MIQIEKMFDKAAKQSRQYCRICGKPVYKHELQDLVAVESKIKVVNLFHRECICKESGCNKTLTFGEVIFR